MDQRSRQRSNAITAAASIASLAGLIATLYYLDIPSFLRQRVKAKKVEPRCYSTGTEPSLAAFKILTQQTTVKETYPLASKITKNVPLYDCNDFNLKNDTGKLDRLQDELYHILASGPGVYVLKNFFTDLSIIDSTNSCYEHIIATELKQNGEAKGDHFAPASANSRIWNSFSKHCLTDAASFVKYYSNPWFPIVCQSYLGPGYKLTSQVNIVRPGGEAQMPHRDYHLGFQGDEDVVKWPKAVHTHLSPFLTLQGAVAHTDMPIESGPTRLLPFSQSFEEGYRSYRQHAFVGYFLQSYVSLPLEKGDAIFFSPALFHAAGANTTEDFSRSANLIQVSSAFGKTMESIDTLPLIEKVYDQLVYRYKFQGMTQELDAFVQAVAEGYPFPTNLDCRKPSPGGMAPESEQDVLRRGISEGWAKSRMVEELTQMREAGSAGGVKR